ncbi:hypothetical protein N5D61_19120 [Pseudomonas sp. GD03842]|nr:MULTISPECIES: hypothetical protein [unclassified Pseudomonas]MDH0748437.1 hypothetical protein [Pseudomonas sp. GD03842]
MISRASAVLSLRPVASSKVDTCGSKVYEKALEQRFVALASVLL